MADRTTGGITGKGGKNVDPLYNVSPSPLLPRDTGNKMTWKDPGFSRTAEERIKAASSKPSKIKVAYK